MNATSILLAIVAVLGIVTFVLSRKTEKIYAGCTTPVVFRGRKYTHHYVCGRLQNLGRYGHETPPPRDFGRACRGCRIRSHVVDCVAAVWLLYSVIAGFVIATISKWPPAMGMALPLLPLVVLMAFYSTRPAFA